MKRNLIGVAVLVLLASFGFAQSSLFSAKVMLSIFPLPLPGIMLEAKLPVSAGVEAWNYGVLARGGFVLQVVLGEVYGFWMPARQDNWTFTLGGGVLGNPWTGGSFQDNSALFVAGGFEYAFNIPQVSKASLDFNLALPWIYDRNAQNWIFFGFPSPVLRFNLIFPF